MAKLTRQEVRALINKLEVRAEALELEAIAKSKARHEQRRLEGRAARNEALILRSNIQELAALLHT